MRRSILIITFMLIALCLSADFYLIPYSDTTKISENELIDKSLNFLIYARNEIFARHGYIFKNKDLDIYFRNMNWYKKRSREVILNEIEEYNVTLLKKIENYRNKDLDIYPKNLPYRYFYNGKPLFYLAVNNYNETQGQVCYDEGKLLLLDSSSNWTLSCKSIPDEYLEINCIGQISNIKDGCIAIEDSTRIQIYDIDNTDHILYSRTKNEVVIQAKAECGSLNGWIYIIGNDKNNEFVTIFQAEGDLKKLQTLDDDIVEIHLLRRISKDNYPKASGLIQKYRLNRKSNKQINIPFSSEKLIYHYEYQCINKVPVYADAISASDKNISTLTDYLQNGQRIQIFEFYYSPKNYDSKDVFNNLKAFWIESQSGTMKGWVNIDDFKYNFKPLFAGG